MDIIDTDLPFTIQWKNIPHTHTHKVSENKNKNTFKRFLKIYYGFSLIVIL